MLHFASINKWLNARIMPMMSYFELCLPMYAYSVFVCLINCSKFQWIHWWLALFTICWSQKHINGKYLLLIYCWLSLMHHVDIWLYPHLFCLLSSPNHSNSARCFDHIVHHLTFQGRILNDFKKEKKKEKLYIIDESV